MYTQTPSASQPKEYYLFENYISRQRMLTYWYQIKEVLSLRPNHVLEIGVGAGLVAAYLRSVGINVKTLDINSDLRPDYCGSILQLNEIVDKAKFDLILCARVLHHIPYQELGLALEQIAQATNKYLILTLPFEDFAFYFGFRYTSAQQKIIQAQLPLWLKRSLFWNRSRSGLWKIADHENHSLKNVNQIIAGSFHIICQYRIPEDAAHQVFVCQRY